MIMKIIQGGIHVITQVIIQFRRHAIMWDSMEVIIQDIVQGNNIRKF